MIIIVIIDRKKCNSQVRIRGERSRGGDTTRAEAELKSEGKIHGVEVWGRRE